MANLLITLIFFLYSSFMTGYSFADIGNSKSKGSKIMAIFVFLLFLISAVWMGAFLTAITVYLLDSFLRR